MSTLSAGGGRGFAGGGRGGWELEREWMALWPEDLVGSVSAKKRRNGKRKADFKALQELVSGEWTVEEGVRRRRTGRWERGGKHTVSWIYMKKRRMRRRTWRKSRDAWCEAREMVVVRGQGVGAVRPQRWREGRRRGKSALTTTWVAHPAMGV